MSNSVKQLISNKRIITMEINSLMIDKGYSEEFRNWFYEYTNRFDGWTPDIITIDTIADAIDRGVPESDIRKQLQNAIAGNGIVSE